jgi:hypothetical protein
MTHRDRGQKKTIYRTVTEEDGSKNTTTFRPADLHDDQYGADIVTQGEYPTLIREYDLATLDGRLTRQKGRSAASSRESQIIWRSLLSAIYPPVTGLIPKADPSGQLAGGRAVMRIGQRSPGAAVFACPPAVESS